MQLIRFGKSTVGPGHAPLIIPDIDMFFNADMAMATTLVKGVKAAGLSLIKAAIITDAAIVYDKDVDETYLDNSGKPVSVNYRALLDKKVMSPEQHIELFDFIRSHGLEMVVSVYDLQGVEMAVEQGCVGIKIASSNITHKPLIEAIAATNLPILMDTGKSVFAEVTRALDWIRSVNPQAEVVIEHSPYAPPAPIEKQNLMAIPYLRDALCLNVGLSHHAHGELMILASVALHPAVIEFGLCNDQADSDQDVYHAVSVGSLAQLVRDVESIYRALGSGEDFIAREHLVNRGRMSIRAERDLQSGESLSLENIAFSFPILGIPVEQWDEVVGRTLARPIPKGEPIQFTDLA